MGAIWLRGCALRRSRTPLVLSELQLQAPTSLAPSEDAPLGLPNLDSPKLQGKSSFLCFQRSLHQAITVVAENSLVGD